MKHKIENRPEGTLNMLKSSFREIFGKPEIIEEKVKCRDIETTVKGLN